MAIDYSALLTADQKRTLIQQRIQQFAADAYQHELNLEVGKKLGDGATVEQSQAALATLEAAIAVHQAELDKLGDE